MALSVFLKVTYPIFQFFSRIFTPRLFRQFNIDKWAWQALKKGDLARAQALAEECLCLNSKDKSSWNYGNAVHEAQQVLGMVRLRQGDVKAARRHLLLAGASRGSPQLDSYGPQMILAREFLLRDERKIVLRYLRGVRKFYVDANTGSEVKAMNEETMVAWEMEVKAGRVPQHPNWE